MKKHAKATAAELDKKAELERERKRRRKKYIQMKLRAIDRNSRLSLSLLFAGIVFFFFVITIGIVTGVILILVHLNVLTSGNVPQTKYIVLFTSLGSILLGTMVAFFAGRVPLKPINRLINAIKHLADGKYRTHLSFSGPLAKHPAFKELSESFNQLADELQNTEMLRSDFINNLSHEFKTPIVSIAGFAGLLKHGHLTEEQKEEYIAIIEEESRRLAYMATNVLNLTRVESQRILSDTTDFNVSEQIRNCVLLLESKWSKMNLEPFLNLKEYTLHGNEEMMKQVWINLIDNAIKFNRPGGFFAIDAQPDERFLKITVANSGAGIPPDRQEKIFRKFYQADESHATQGNGIGLSIVKSIVELHHGQVTVASDPEKTVFTVFLPWNEEKNLK